MPMAKTHFARLRGEAACCAGLGAHSIEGLDTSEGHYAVFFADPNGNRLEVAFFER